MREYALSIAPLARIPVDVESWCRFHLTQKLAIIHSFFDSQAVVEELGMCVFFLLLILPS